MDAAVLHALGKHLTANADSQGSRHAWPTAGPACCSSTSVTFEPARHTASILFETSGLLGMPPNGSKIRRGEAPQVGVACENPSLDWKQPTSLFEYALGTH